MFKTLGQAKGIKSQPQLPNYVVVAGAKRGRGLPPGFSSEASGKLIEQGIEMQKRLLELNPDGKLVILDDVSHYMHLEKPEKVVSLISQIVEEIRQEFIGFCWSLLQGLYSGTG